MSFMQTLSNIFQKEKEVETIDVNYETVSEPSLLEQENEALKDEIEQLKVIIGDLCQSNLQAVNQALDSLIKQEDDIEYEELDLDSLSDEEAADYYSIV